MSLRELIERVEAASEGSRELDADIALTQGWQELPGDNWLGPEAQIVVPHYSTSVDAALTLVPTECRFNLSKRPFAEGRQDGYHAQVWYSRYYASVHDIPNAYAFTPALALVAASLRALQHQKEAGHG